MPFECSQCGECCSHLGLVHQVEVDYGDNRFLIRNQYSGERTNVVIDPDKIALFSDRTIFTTRPEACPFFRFDEAVMKGYCTVHQTRPEICRDYGCWRILILDGTGKRAGRIMCQRHIASEDDHLTRLFSEQVDPLIGLDDDAWDKLVIHVVTAAGFTVRI
ncbi:MAG: YkgJ family cysteine cluster protein [Methanomicrobiales archaeon]|nr:YkgJ family cysteine cluster protein [Methanomicrobiales archaeon]